jgi:hypothetical protein
MQGWAYTGVGLYKGGLIQGWAYTRVGLYTDDLLCTCTCTIFIHGRSFVLVINKSDINKSVINRKINKQRLLGLY